MKYHLALPLMSLFLVGCLQKELQTGLTEQEAQGIIVLLKENGIDASRQVMEGDAEKPLWTISVGSGSDNFFQALRILHENGLPRERLKGLDEVFSKSGLIPTASEEKARLILGLSGEISHTLTSVSGVVDARVHVVLPENSPLVDKTQWSATTASVLLKYQGNQPPFREDEIRNLVAKGIEGLQPENVVVVFKRLETKTPPPRNLRWYLRSQEIVAASLGLLLLATIGSLVLVVQGRQQRAKIQSLNKQLRALASRGQISAESGEKA